MNPALSGDRTQKTVRGSQTPLARPSEHGIVLVISLLLLSVITFMAVTFLVVSRSERGAVSTSTDQTVARLAADAALERAQSELLAPIISSTNEQNYGLLVSTNFINAAGFKSGVSSYTNVNYNGPFPTVNDLCLNLANLLYNPRPPVFIANPANPAAAPDFRFYLDLNRNGRYDANGLLPVINPNGGYYDLAGNQIPSPVSGNTLSNFFVGDPEWIGLLEKPGFPHSANNRFISRIAYVALPAGQALDVNYIHNYAKNLNSGMTGGNDSFLRDEGVGTWEINLAAFLTDFNTNQWQPVTAQYTYNWQNLGVANSGAAFDDALAFLRYRYAGTPSSLASVSSLFGANGNSAFQYDLIDGYSAGPVMITNYWNLTQDPDFNRTGQPWPGADNTNHFWNLLSDLFDPTKTSVSFTNHLLTPGTNTSSYDRYTFYRLLSQIGTDSAHEANKINLNYDNLVQATSGVVSETNFIPWRPIDFFNVTALRLLTNAGFTVGIGSTNLVVPTNNPGGLGFQIQIYPTNFYTPSVHRLLQLAANIYDATTNRTYDAVGLVSGFPTVFQPLFSNLGTTNVYIVGYQEVTNTTLTATHMHDLSNPNDRPAVWPTSDMFYGVPVVIGAKKGFPSFNQFAMQNDITGTRKLLFYRAAAGQLVNSTNQVFSLTISNAFGLEAWNSYNKIFPRELQILGAVDVFMGMTNEHNNLVFTNFVSTGFGPTNIIANAWSGYSPGGYANSFIVPLFTNYFSLTNAAYVHSTSQGNFAASGWDTNTFLPPLLWLNLTTRVRFIMVDTKANRIVDYVNLSLSEPPIDIAAQLATGATCDGAWHNQIGDLFCTNGPAGSALNYGLTAQIHISQGNPVVDNNFWTKFNATANDEASSQQIFRQRWLNPPLASDPSPDFGTPFNPTRTVHHYVSWQANDPLVHYTVPDLTDALGGATNMEYDAVTASPLPYLHPPNNIRNPPLHYRPWIPSLTSDTTPATMYNLAVKDPQVTGSDSWNFPTNKFPNVGWLGRVHRGTPWQTVYLKSPTNDLNTWTKWTGNNLAVTNFGQIATNLPPVFGTTNLVPLYTNSAGTIVGVAADALFSQPVNDRGILDLFTAAFNDNATRGQMSINQASLAGWSAVLGGVVVLTNTTPQVGPVVISPAGAYSASTLPGVVRIVNAINNVRQTNSIGQSFHRLGELLGVPELTVASPFLNNNIASSAKNFPTDDAYERLPQQILGLVKADPVPRFVIYSYGQALKPAANSIITESGSYFGLCTNYQITAEVATRAVVRIDGAPANPHAVIENFNVLPPD